MGEALKCARRVFWRDEVPFTQQFPLSFEGEIYRRRVKKRRSLKTGSGSFRGAKPLLHNLSPFPLLRGRGRKGDGVPK